MRRPSPLAVCLSAFLAWGSITSAAAAAGAQEPPPDLPPGFTDGRPVGGDAPEPSAGARSSGDASTASVETTDTMRYFGEEAYAAVRASVAATSRSCSITDDGLTALVLAPVFKESSAATSPSTAPSPMTLSRYDEWNGIYATTSNQSANYGLYAFRDPYTPYLQAYWHPGIGIWQYDSAGIGAPFTAVERMHVGIMAADVAKNMAGRYCSASGSDQDRRYEAWRDWGYPCTLCQGYFDEMMGTSPKFANLGLVPGIGVLGGTVERSCTLPGVPGIMPCWYVNPSVGTIQGATAWATLSPTGGSGPTVTPAPLSKPFYVLDRGATEERHWLRADTGYGIDVHAVRQIGKNARPRSAQTGSGLEWRNSSGLCDITAGRGSCVPVPPAGVSSAPVVINGTYRATSLDANGDDRGDVLWYAPGTATDSVWLGQGAGSFTGVAAQINGTYDDVLTGDIDGDGLDDILWYARDNGASWLWRSRGDGTFSSTSLSPGAGRLPLLLDVDVDDALEVMWYGPGSLSDSLWDWQGTGFVASPRSINGTYQPFVGDFDGNGRDDIFWYAPGGADDFIWLHRVTGGYLSVLRKVNGTNQPVVGDLDGDGADDVFWYAPGTAADSVWYGAPGATFATQQVAVNGTYAPLVADLEGDGRDDVIWYAPGSAGDFWWRWTVGRVVTSASLVLPGQHQGIVGAYSAGGADGIVWHQAGSTPDVVWYR